MNPSDFEETLTQSGVKGMHWGVRKDDSKSMGLTDQQKAARRDLYKRLAVAGAVIAAGLLVQHGPTVMSQIANRAEVNRGLAKVPQIMAKAAPLKYAKNSGGVYKITTL